MPFLENFLFCVIDAYLPVPSIRKWNISLTFIFPKIKFNLTLEGKLLAVTTGTQFSVTHPLPTLTARIFWGLLRSYNKGQLGNSAALWPFLATLHITVVCDFIGLESSSTALVPWQGEGLSAQEPAARGGPSLMLFWGSVPSLRHQKLKANFCSFLD